MRKLGKACLGFFIVMGAMLLREIAAIVWMYLYAIGTTVTEGAEAVRMERLLDTPDFLLLLSSAGMAVWILFFGILYHRRRKREESVFFSGRIGTRRILALLGMGLGLQLAVNAALGALSLVAREMMDSYAKMVESLGMGESPLSLILIVGLAPVAEELVFRGAVLGYLERHMSFMAANLLQALFFGMYHWNPVQGCYAFVIGALLGWLVRKYGSVREAILLHMAVNLSGCLVGYLLPDTLITRWWGFLILLLPASVLLVFSIRAVTMEETEQAGKGGNTDDGTQNYGC